jgi:DNA invertase Pin-like site-specific DNA recombinase
MPLPSGLAVADKGRAKLKRDFDLALCSSAKSQGAVLARGYLMPDPIPQGLTPAAEYVRMSTDQQSFSIQHQRAANAAYAALHGFEIVRTYADEGVSGVRLNGRHALKQLLADVLGGQADFTTILTHDVSRWGRFQDPDQGAHYEFICRESGVQVVYCAEPFENDGSLTSTLVKHLKRAMAAEYSRELSAKVSLAQSRFAQAGFWQGGPPGFALRRQIVNANGSLGAILQAGQGKVRGERVVVTLGPPAEVEIVRTI